MPFDAEHFTAPVRILDRDPKSLTTPRERLEYLSAFLRNQAPAFYMGVVGKPECGTPACFYGWTRHLFMGGFGDEYQAASMLGLPREVANLGRASLFFPLADLPGGGDAITLRDPTRAANVLDHLIRTGEVDWSVA